MNFALKNEDIVKILSRPAPKAAPPKYEFNDIKSVRNAILSSPADGLFEKKGAQQQQQSAQCTE